MLDDRTYMRQTPFRSGRSATMMLLVANVLAFILECIIYGYPPLFPPDGYLALSWAGLRHGYVWQLLTFQFLHAGLIHLLVNCWVIYAFGRDLEQALGVKRFLTLYFGSGIIGGLFQGLAGGLADHFGTSAWLLRFAGPTVGASAGAFGLLAAFATLYPERPLTFLIFFVIPVSVRAKFLLLFFGLLAVFGIFFPGAGNMANVAHLGGMLAGILFARYALSWEWPQFKRLRRQPSRRLGKAPSPKASFWARSKVASDADLPPEEFLSKEVDPILDKITAQGIQSLTARERRILEAARERMAKR